MPTQSTTVLASQSRQGSFTSSSVTIPSGILRIKLIANILLADKLADGKTLTLDVERSPDNGANWFNVAGFGWTSYGAAGYPAGKDGIANPDPSLSFVPTAYVGQRFRLILAAPTAITFGGTVDITT